MNKYSVFLGLFLSSTVAFSGNNWSVFLSKQKSLNEYSIANLVPANMTLIDWFEEGHEDPVRMYILVCLTESLLFASLSSLKYDFLLHAKYEELYSLWGKHKRLKKHQKMLSNVEVQMLSCESFNEKMFSTTMNEEDAELMQWFSDTINLSVMHKLTGESFFYVEKFMVE